MVGKGERKKEERRGARKGRRKKSRRRLLVVGCRGWWALRAGRCGVVVCAASSVGLFGRAVGRERDVLGGWMGRGGTLTGGVRGALLVLVPFFSAGPRWTPMDWNIGTE